MIQNIFLIIIAYLLGSISSAVWIGKRFYGVDVREHGSKNAGATNVMRVLGRKAAAPVFIIDFMKGFVAVKLALLAVGLDNDPSQEFYMEMALAVAAVLGHIFPIFAKFKGGKGVATIAGAALSMTTIPILLSLATFIIVLLITKYVSLGSMAGGIGYPLFLLFVEKESIEQIIFGVVIAIALIITHRKNIKRLIKGEESKTYLIRKWKKKE
ncbi:MAG: glycerol-3-phosphate 1-O-acyltransferase PlsY [Rikenellaceae bacterium]